MSGNEWLDGDPDLPEPEQQYHSPDPGQTRRRSALGPTLVVLAVIVLLVSYLATFWTDVMWYSSVGFTSVFRTQIVTKIELFILGFGITGGLVWLGLWLGHRTRPIFVPMTPAEQVLDRYRAALEPVRRLVTILTPVVLGLLAGSAATSQWQTVLLWFGRQSFGVTDPQFGKDVGFFVFTLPLVRFVLGFLTIALVLGMIAAAVSYYIYGSLPLPGRGRPTRAAVTHLAVLGALLALTRAATYWVDRYSLAVTDNALITGIRYTDAHAVLPTKAILAVAACITAGLFLAAIWTRSWRLPIIGVALLVVTAVVAGSIYPALIQSIKVKPSEKTLEREYIQRSIDATRAAYGLDQVRSTPYQAKTDASPGQLRNDAETIPGIRLVDPIVVPKTFRQLQALKSYYVFPDALDVDRYTIDGAEADAVVAVRELSLDGVPTGQRNWVNDHTVYTHGFGFVGAYGNRRTSDGEPVFFERNIPPAGVLGDFEPRVYFGEQSTQYSIVGAAAGAEAREFDYPDASAEGFTKNTYSGVGGVPIGSFGAKLAYAIKYRELKFLLSDTLNADSRLLDHRTPMERVERVAPWLTTDGNAYPSIIDGRIVWIVDGYTTSANYPYSKLQDLSAATSDSVTDSTNAVTTIGFGRDVNYIRNSVKATVDAFDGTVTLYQWDDQDPLLKAWMKVFPGTVQPTSQISADLMQHLRYPEDLFKVQRMMLSRYHVDVADSFYGGQDFWRVPKDPAQEERVVDQPPYYLSLKMPGQDASTFSLTTTFMPVGDREVLSGFLAVDSDAGTQAGVKRAGYGTLRLLELPRDSTVNGPGQVQNDINSSSVTSPAYGLTLSQFLNNNNRDGSRVTHGNLLTLPVGGGLLYVQPIYISGTAQSAYPKQRITVATFGSRLAWSDTLDGALNALFGGDSGAAAGDTGTGGTTTPSEPVTGDAALGKALADARTAYADGQEALSRGDFAAYGEAQKRLEDALNRAIAAAPEGAAVELNPPTPEPTATATPTTN